MKKDAYDFKYNDIELVFKIGDFITILGNSNDSIARKISSDIISISNISNTSNFKIRDELKKYIKKDTELNDYLENYKLTNIKNEYINNINLNDKVKILLLLLILQGKKIIIINNILSLLDNNDYKLIIKALKNYNENSIIINLTNNENEALFGNKIVIINSDKLICFGGTISVLNEEKTLKRQGIGLPFIIELNKYLMDYGLINGYHLSNKTLVGALWK